MGERSEPTGIGAERRLSLRGGTEPAPYQGNRSSAVYGGVRSPRPTEAPTGRCGHRPLRIEGEATSTTWGSGAERSVCGADGRNGRESQQRSSPKCPATPDNPSVSLRGTGDADCHVGPAGLLAMTMVFCHSEERSDVGIRPFYDGQGFGPPRSSAPTKKRDSCRNHPSQRRTAERLRRGHEEQARIGAEAIKKGQSSATATAALSEAESAERAAGQIRSLPDTLRVQHGAESPEV